jgi:F-type H+-transporting ATPase subunit a
MDVHATETNTDHSKPSELSNQINQEEHAIQSGDSAATTEAHPATTEGHSTEKSSHIVLAPETLGYIGQLPVTNTLLVSWIVMIILTSLAFASTRKADLVPVSRLQGLFEIVVDAVYTLAKDLAADKAKVFFPIALTFFLFIFTANLLGLFPGFATIGFNRVEEGHAVFVPLLRSMGSDLNMTLGLALVSAGLTHYYAVKYLGIGGYLKKWFSLNPIMLFVGVLELVSEVTKVVSLSFRLFGNIFAGEVVLATISGLLAFIAPLPFYFLELIVAFVQAAVFMMLTLVFMSLLAEKHESH